MRAKPRNGSRLLCDFYEYPIRRSIVKLRLTAPVNIDNDRSAEKSFD